MSQRGAAVGLVALLASWPLGAARAEDALIYKYEDYRETGQRIGVREQAASASQDLTPDVNLKLTGTLDAIAGATPTGQPAANGSSQVPLTELNEYRKEWTGDLTGHLGHFSVDAGFADSRESDYVSAGWSINTVTDFNEKNTSLLLGVAGTSDRVEVFFEPAYLPKHSTDGVMSLTQLLDPLTSISLAISGGRVSGYLGEQHKLVQKTIQFLPGVSLAETFGENRPDEKSRGDAVLTLHRAFPALAGALEASDRVYHDTFGVSGNTVELAWFQHLGTKVSLRPFFRFYDQTAANFYHYNLDQTSIIPVRIPLGQGPYYSSDYRISALDSYSLGAQAVWKVSDWIQFDLALERYAMQGRDGVTPQSAYPLAAITTAGVKVSW